MTDSSNTGRATGGKPASSLLSLLVLPLLPVFFLAAAASIPYSRFKFRSSERRERQLVKQMRSSGRLITGTTLMSLITDGEGTLIIDWVSSKGPLRCWWTRDRLEDARWSVMPRVFTLAVPPEGYRKTWENYREKYIGLGGQAFLVEASFQEGRELRACLPDTQVRWLDLRPSPRNSA